MTPVPPADNLNICSDHLLAMHSRENDHGRCPACILEEQGHDVDARFDGDVPGRRVNQQEVRQRLDAETVVELLPLVEEYLDDTGNGPVYVVPEKFEGGLPAGYSEAQERWVNVVVYEFGARRKAISAEPSARETIKTLRSEGYGDD